MGTTWKRGTATIRARSLDGGIESHDVPAWIWSYWAVHETFGVPGGSWAWTVTHRPTGRVAVQDISAKDIAQRLAEWLDPQQDWATFPDRDSTRTPFAARVRAQAAAWEAAALKGVVTR
jgi:hypothetical protein